MAKRRPLIAANWKMNGLTKDSLSRAKGLVTRVKKLDKANVEVLICPPFTMLHAINQILKGSMIKIGGQDCHYKNFGAYTGDIAPLGMGVPPSRDRVLNRKNSLKPGKHYSG